VLQTNNARALLPSRRRASHRLGSSISDQPAVEPAAEPPAPAMRPATARRAKRAPGGNDAWKAIDDEPRWSYLELRRYFAERRLRWARNTV
jgi:hypothetical protein